MSYKGSNNALDIIIVYFLLPIDSTNIDSEASVLFLSTTLKDVFKAESSLGKRGKKPNVEKTVLLKRNKFRDTK